MFIKYKIKLGILLRYVKRKFQGELRIRVNFFFRLYLLLGKILLEYYSSFQNVRKIWKFRDYQQIDILMVKMLDICRKNSLRKCV